MTMNGNIAREDALATMSRALSAGLHRQTSLSPREQRAAAKAAMMLAQAEDEWFAPSRLKKEISNAQAHADRRDRADDRYPLLRQSEPGVRRHLAGCNRTAQDHGCDPDQNSGRGNPARQAGKVCENFQASAIPLG
jgi:hypothetical protein